MEIDGNDRAFDVGYGLTKREHVVIEFTKAMLIATKTSNATMIIKDAITCADELIKQLNQTQK